MPHLGIARTGRGTVVRGSDLAEQTQFAPTIGLKECLMDLFGDVRQKNLDKVLPLAARMRPRSLDEFVGQKHFLGEGKLLRRMLEADRLTSVIFYGPPGT